MLKKSGLFAIKFAVILSNMIFLSDVFVVIQDFESYLMKMS